MKTRDEFVNQSLVTSYGFYESVGHHFSFYEIKKLTLFSEYKTPGELFSVLCKYFLNIFFFSKTLKVNLDSLDDIVSVLCDFLVTPRLNKEKVCLLSFLSYLRFGLPISIDYCKDDFIFGLYGDKNNSLFKHVFDILTETKQIDYDGLKELVSVYAKKEFVASRTLFFDNLLLFLDDPKKDVDLAKKRCALDYSCSKVWFPMDDESFFFLGKSMDEHFHKVYSNYRVELKYKLVEVFVMSHYSKLLVNDYFFSDFGTFIFSEEELIAGILLKKMSSSEIIKNLEDDSFFRELYLDFSSSIKEKILMGLMNKDD